MMRASRRRLALWLGLLTLAVLAACAGVLLYLQAQGVTPRALAPYIERRSAGHNPAISGAGAWLGQTLMRLDRGDAGSSPLPALLPPLLIGAQPGASGSGQGAARPVATLDEARAAFDAALAGDVITFAPGVYRLRRALEARRPGVQGAPVTVRAALPGSVTIEVDGAQGFLVAAPWWRFENLTVRGVCRNQSFCEHAFHVTGKGSGFAAVNNTITDFNAHFKINGSGGSFPDGGLIAYNTLSNGSVRATASPVTPIDLVAGNDWTVRANLILDFVKGGGDRVSYGAFAKGGAARTVFERNVVVCEHLLRGRPGVRVGLSFGGGGTGKRYCRDGRCITEHEGGTMRANLVASCSDAAIYINSGAATRIVHNTLLDSAGVQLRYPQTAATMEGNLVDGAVSVRNDAQLRGSDNRLGALALSYLGVHPARSLFAAPLEYDLRWRDEAPRRAAQPDTQAQADLCGAQRPAAPAYGAFEDFKACLRR